MQAKEWEQSATQVTNDPDKELCGRGQQWAGHERVC